MIPVKYIHLCGVAVAMFLATGCASTTKLGTVLVASTRNVDTTKDWVLIKRYVEIEGKTLEAAISSGVREYANARKGVDGTPTTGAEFMMNLRCEVSPDGEVSGTGDIMGYAAPGLVPPSKESSSSKKTEGSASEKKPES